MKYYIFLVNQKGEEVRYLSLLDPKIAFKNGIIGKAIAGIVKGNESKITPNNFIANKEFKEFMHSIIGKEIFKDPHIKQEAERTKDDFVFIIDARTIDPKGKVPPYDIIGAVKTENGKLVKDSYNPNPNYALVAPSGIFQLPKFLEEKLIKALNKI